MAAKPALGLYLTDQFIQLARVNGDGTHLTHFFQSVLPNGVIVNGEVKNKVELVRQIQEARRGLGGGNGERVIVGVGDNRVFLREFTIPKLPGKDIEDAINWQIRSLLPVLPAEVETDWKMIGRDANEQVEVLLAAIPKTVINAYVEVAQEVGLNVIGLEPAVLANIRAIDPIQLKGKNQLLVYLSEAYAEISYLTNGQPRLNDYLQATDIQKRGDIGKIITDYINFVNSKHPHRPVGEVIISGSHPGSSNLIEHLAELNVTTFEAKKRVTETKFPNKALLTTVGLSLKPHVDNDTLNLLPLEMKLTEHVNRLEKYWQGLLGILIIASLSFLTWVGLTFNSLRIEVNNLQAEKSAQEALVTKEDKNTLATNIMQFNAIADQLESINQVTGGEELILADLAASVPPGVSLSSLVYNRDVSSVKLADKKSSWIVTGIATSRPLVLQFYDQLITKETYPNGRLYYGSLERESGVDFRIAGTPVTK